MSPIRISLRAPSAGSRPGLTSVIARSEVAGLANSLDEIAPDRVYLTIGPGFISTRSIGRPRTGVTFMRQVIGDLRGRLAGAEVAFGEARTHRNRARSAPPSGAARASRSLDGVPEVFIVAIGLGADADVGIRWVRRSGKPASRLTPRTIPPPLPKTKDARSPTRSGCQRKAMLTHSSRRAPKPGIDSVLLFPADDPTTGHSVREAERRALERVIRPRRAR